MKLGSAQVASPKGKKTASKFKLGIMDLYEQASLQNLEHKIDKVVEETKRTLEASGDNPD